MCQPPIKSGYVRVVSEKIAEVGSVRDANFDRANAIDLGDVALLPRLVNAHTHLEFSDCDQVIGEPGIPLADWIGQVIRQRGMQSNNHRKICIEKGIAESFDSGVGFIGDIATTPSVYPDHPLARILSFAEVLGLSPERSAERLGAAETHRESLQRRDARHGHRVQFGVSPHAPYSTPPTLIRQCVEFANQFGTTLAMHVAESPEERTLLESGTGRFADSLRAAGLWQDGLFPWSGTAPLLDLIDCLAAAPRALLVHGNDLRGDEIERIARYRQLGIVYCPRTHHFFGYPEHPIQALLDAGIPVALGTDSRASNPDLNLWKEVQFLLNRRSDLDPYSVLNMATKSAADALLGEGSGIGIISGGVGGIADLVAVKTNANRLDQVWRDFAEGELLCSGTFGRA